MICNISFKNLDIDSTLHIIKYTEIIFIFLKCNVYRLVSFPAIEYCLHSVNIKSCKRWEDCKVCISMT
jgi:hypothetical protein